MSPLIKRKKKPETPADRLKKARREAQLEMDKGIVRGPKAQSFIRMRERMLDSIEEAYEESKLEAWKARRQLHNTTAFRDYLKIAWFSQRMAEQWPEHYKREKQFVSVISADGTVPPKVAKEMVRKKMGWPPKSVRSQVRKLV